VTRGTEVVAGEVKPAQEIHSDGCAIQRFLRCASPLSYVTQKPHLSLSLLFEACYYTIFLAQKRKKKITESATNQ